MFYFMEHFVSVNISVPTPLAPHEVLTSLYMASGSNFTATIPPFCHSLTAYEVRLPRALHLLSYDEQPTCPRKAAVCTSDAPASGFKAANLSPTVQEYIGAFWTQAVLTLCLSIKSTRKPI